VNLGVKRLDLQREQEDLDANKKCLEHILRLLEKLGLLERESHPCVIREMEGLYEEEFDFGETMLMSLLAPFLARDVMEWGPLEEPQLLPTIFVAVQSLL